MKQFESAHKPSAALTKDAPRCTLRRYQAADLPRLLTLLEESFGRWPNVPIEVPAGEHLAWKLRSTPESERYQVVAEANGRLVGALLFIVQPVNAGEGILLSRSGTDGCVAFSARGQGLMQAMREYARDEFGGTFDLYLGSETRHPAMKALSERDGGDLFGNPIDVLVCPLDWRAALGTVRVKPGRSPRKIGRDLAGLVRWTKRDAGRPSRQAYVREVDSFDEAFDALWLEASQPCDFAIERTCTYLNWRYADPRGGRFTILSAYDLQGPTGYAVLRSGGAKAHLADLVALPGREDVVQALLREVLQRAEESGATIVEGWLSRNHEHMGAYQAAGFLRRRTQRLKYRQLNERANLSFLADPQARLHITLGDFDVV